MATTKSLPCRGKALGEGRICAISMSPAMQRERTARLESADLNLWLGRV
jgi:hypothetical protein